MALSPHAIRTFGGILTSRTGQELADSRLWRIETVLQPLLRAHNIESLEMLAMMVASERNAELADQVAEALINHESFFFRDPQAFVQLSETIATRLRTARMATRRLRVWSAGCSTGQEAYSLAMIFAERPELWDGWEIEILGTDVSRTAIDRATAAVYSQFEIQRGLPVRQMLRWFEPQSEDWRAIDALRSRVRFHVHNVVDGPRFPIPFDIILCRNVLLYFSSEARTTVFARLHGAIAADGVLALGAGETAMGQTTMFECDPEARGLYRPLAAKGASARAA